MAKYDTLSAELWNAIFAQLCDKDRRSAAASCQYFRAWRAFAWSELQITVPDARNLRLLVRKLRRLAVTLEADNSLRSFVRSIFLRRSMIQWSTVTDLDICPANTSLDVDAALAYILGLSPGVERFISEAPSEICNHELTLLALCKLSALKILVLAQVPSSRLALGMLSSYRLESHVLEQLIFLSGPKLQRSRRVDLSAYVGEQKLLKFVALPINHFVSLDLAMSWVAVEELIMGLDTEGWRRSVVINRWPDVVASGLVIIYHGNRERYISLTSFVAHRPVEHFSN